MGVRVVFPDMGKDPSIQLIEKTITENGTYDALTDGANGYSKVNVNVEGGGGSSDFSTAQVTITNATLEDMVGLGFVCYNENEAGEGSPSMILNRLMIPKGETVIFKVPLYKGMALWNNPFANVGNFSTTTGNVLNEHGNFTITGNGTITLHSPS